MRVLVIESEAKSAAYLTKGLAESGFVSDVARTGIDGQHLALTGNYDAVVLDLILTGPSGWNALCTIRASKATPILCVTARDRVEDRLRAFELGADDLLVTPFAFSELLARLRSIMRRARVAEPAALQVADLQIDPPRRRASRGGMRLDLTPQQFSLLEVLATRPGEVYSRGRLVEVLWDMNFESDTNVVDVAVRRLRARVDDPFPRKLIHTVRGVGYVLEER